MKLTDEMVNKKIAEFMGLNCEEYTRYKISNFIGFDTLTLYTDSLDALVPVWEKLLDIPAMIKNSNGCHAWFERCPVNCQYDKVVNEASGKTIQQAAAHATYKAIMETENESNR